MYSYISEYIVTLSPLIRPSGAISALIYDTSYIVSRIHVLLTHTRNFECNWLSLLRET